MAAAVGLFRCSDVRLGSPRGGPEAGSYDACQPQIRIPRKVVKGGSGWGQASVDSFVSEARVWLAEATQPKPKSKSARAPRKPSTAPTVEALSPNEYASRLKQAARDNRQFDDELIERLRDDKRVKKADMREIAQLFLGYEIAKKKGREDALAAIVERQQVDARQDARGSLLDRLKSW
jgi:hypothetical protein